MSNESFSKNFFLFTAPGVNLCTVIVVGVSFRTKDEANRFTPTYRSLTKDPNEMLDHGVFPELFHWSIHVSELHSSLSSN